MEPPVVGHSLKFETESGKEWAEDYLHPPSTQVNEAHGIPDDTPVPSVTFGFENALSITAPVLPEKKLWNVLILHIPSPQFPVAYLAYEAGKTPDFRVMKFFLNPNFDFGKDARNWDVAAKNYRPIGNSLTVLLNAASLYNQGVVYSTQTQFNRQLDESTTENQTRIVYSDNISRFPTTGSEILQQSYKSYQGLIKDGLFQVLFQNNPSYPWSDNASQVWGITGFGPDGELQRSEPDYDASLIYVLPSLHRNYGITLVEGLLPEEALSLKLCHSWEVMTGLGSPFSAIKKQTTPPDDEALKTAALVQFHMQDAYPASYNSFGSIWKFLKKAVPTIYSAIKPIASTVLMSLGPEGQAIKTGIDAGEGALKALVHMSKKKKKKTNPKVVVNKPSPKKIVTKSSKM